MELMSQKGSVVVAIFIAGVLILAVGIVSGSFYIKNNTNLLSKTNIGENSKQVNHEAQDLVSFDSPCISFKYPQTWQKDSEKIVNDHIVGTKGDTYGSTIISLRKTDKSVSGIEQVFNLAFMCVPIKLVKPATFTDIFKIDQEDFENHKSENTPQDKIEQINIGGVTFDKTTRNAYINQGGGSRIGTILMNGLSDNYRYAVTLSWAYPNGNNSDLETKKEFEAIVQSMNIKK